MANRPEITALTIVYNGERYIRQAIDSILNQTCSDFEYILVDNNSTDNTPGILADYADSDKRITVISESKQGVLYARNAGLRAAKGNWIAVLDSDDIALPNRLESQLGFIRENPDVVLVGSGCTMIDEDGNFLKSYRYPAEHGSLLRALEGDKAFFPHSSAFYNIKVAMDVGGYRFPHAEDADLFLRLVMHGKMACLNQPLIKLRRFVASRSYNIAQEPYILFHLLGLMCHFRRKQGLSDPYESEKDGDRFLQWTKTRMESLDCFSGGLAKRELCRIWYSREHTKLYRLCQILFRFLTDSYSRAYMLDRSYLGKSAIQIAEESKAIFKA